jgi:putative flippase GtrA
MNSTKLTQRDLLFGAINGLIFGALLPVVLQSFNVTGMPPYIITIAFFAIFAAIGVYIGYLLSKIKTFFFQLAKFGATGAANSAIDIGVLALLVASFYSETAIIPTIPFILFRIISFLLANTNSYFWNKFWSFKSKTTKNVVSKTEKTTEFGKFITVSIIGLVINVTISSIVNSLQGYTPINPQTWATIAAVAGTIATLTWNFLGYKLIVFKK